MSYIRSSAPVQITLHPPDTKEGRHKLSKEAADIHADMAIQYIQNLNCPARQKTELLNAILKGLKSG